MAAASAINGSNRLIQAATAVVVSNGVARLASPGTLATHVTSDGAPPGGVLTIHASGTIFLKNWKLSTGATRLKVGAPYYVAAGGKLTSDGDSTVQAVGQAISPYELSIQVQVNISPPPYTVIQQTIQQDVLGSRILIGCGSPLPGTGNATDLYFDFCGSAFYGPKFGSAWGSPLHFF